MRKISASRSEPTETQKAEALTRALKKVEEGHPKARSRRSESISEDALDQMRSEVRARFASDDEYEAWKKETTRKSRGHMDAWIRNPPWFTFYDPYSSVLSGTTPAFTDANGKKLEFRSPDAARQLLYLAKSAADEYLSGNALTREDWNKELGNSKRMVNELRTDMRASNFQFRDPLGHSVSPNVDEFSPFQVLSIAHQLFSKNWVPSEEEQDREDDGVKIGFLHKLWCVICLSEVDSALLSVLYEDAGDGIASAIEAAEALGYARELRRLAAAALKSPALDPLDRGPLVVPLRREFALAGAKARLAKDPKQAAKREVKNWWIRWRANPTWYQSKSSFARVMLDKFPVLSSQPVIEAWCRQWEKAEDAS